MPGLPPGGGLRVPDWCEAAEYVRARDPVRRLGQQRGGMQTKRRLPLLGKRAPSLPRVAVKLDGPFGGISERRDAASSARVLAQADAPAVVQRLLPGLGERHLGIRPEPDRGDPSVDPDALPPRLRDPAASRPVDPETQPPPAASVAVDSGSADRPNERGGECPRSLGHGLPSLVVYHFVPHYRRKNTPDANGTQETVLPGSSRQNHCNTGCYGTASGLLWIASDHDWRVQLGLRDLLHLPSYHT